MYCTQLSSMGMIGWFPLSFVFKIAYERPKFALDPLFGGGEIVGEIVKIVGEIVKIVGEIVAGDYCW
jgi:hypothetical protein